MLKTTGYFSIVNSFFIVNPIVFKRLAEQPKTIHENMDFFYIYFRLKERILNNTTHANNIILFMMKMFPLYSLCIPIRHTE